MFIACRILNMLRCTCVTWSRLLSKSLHSRSIHTGSFIHSFIYLFGHASYLHDEHKNNRTPESRPKKYFKWGGGGLLWVPRPRNKVHILPWTCGLPVVVLGQFMNYWAECVWPVKVCELNARRGSGSASVPLQAGSGQQAWASRCDPAVSLTWESATLTVRRQIHGSPFYFYFLFLFYYL